MQQQAVVETPPGVDPEKWARSVRIVAARKKLLPFVRWTFPGYNVSRAHEYLAGKLEEFEVAVREHRSPRLMVFLPPRFGKSELTSRRYPGWVLGRNPDWNVGIVSYGAELAEELSSDARRVVLGDEYAEVFGRLYQPDSGSTVELDRSSQAVNHWRIAGHRGGVRAVGVGGALTGRGFDVCIIDDPIKGRKEADSDLVREDLWKWYQGTLRTRLEPGGGLLLIQTRWHHDDLAGRLLRAADDLRQRGAPAWEVVSLPAIAGDNDPLGRAVGEPLDPNRFDADELAALKHDIGSRDWIAQYQQSPTPDEGAIFNRDWFNVEPVPDKRGFILQVWDTAFSERREADYSAGFVIRLEGNCYRLLDRVKERLTYPRLKERVKALATNDRYRANAVLIEDMGSGKSLVQDLKNETRLPILTYRPDRDKIARAHAVTAICESKRVILPQGAPWLEDFLSEVTQFPSGEHDDQVDALSMALSVAGVWNAPPRRQVIQREFRIVA